MSTKKTGLLIIFISICAFCLLFYLKSSATQPLIKSTGNVTKNTVTEDFQEGDILFQSSLSAQSQAIELATSSPYSHCGMVVKNNGAFYVLEAVQPVKYTPLASWINRGKGKVYAVKRLVNAQQLLTSEKRTALKNMGEQFVGKSYDLTFEWSDNKMYCSELIWKIYDRALGIQLGSLEKLGDFELSSPTVQSLMKERYGTSLPLQESVISPAAIFASELLYTPIIKD